jgi:hypothetical protein
MQENTTPISQRETYVPTKWTRFLWWLSTAEKGILADCVVDRNRYAIVGMTVLAPGLLLHWPGPISLVP